MQGCLSAESEAHGFVSLILAGLTRPPDSVVLCPFGWQGAKCSFPPCADGDVPLMYASCAVFVLKLCGVMVCAVLCCLLKIQDQLGLYPLQTDFGFFPEI